MGMTIGEAQDLNTLLDYLVDEPRPGLGAVTEEQAREAAVRLAGKAFKSLTGGGFSADRLAEAWPRQRVVERPRPVGNGNPVYQTNGDRVWIALDPDTGRPGFEIVRDPDDDTVTVSPIGRPWEAHTMSPALARLVFAAGLAATDPPREQR